MAVLGGRLVSPSTEKKDTLHPQVQSDAKKKRKYM